MERGFGLKAATGPIAPAFYDRFNAPATTGASQAPSTPSELPVTSPAPSAAEAPITPPLQDSTTASQLSSIENQKSKIENSYNSHSSPASHSSENPITPPLHDSATPILLPSIQNQNSKNENLLCHACEVPRPARLLNDPRPYGACPACNTQLPPRGSRFDKCQFCGALQPIFRNNQRAKDYCHRCGITLPPPGQRYVEKCPKCGIELPMITKEGVRLWNLCSECHTPLPLLEPVPPEPNATMQPI
jgi:hypothetical protein